METRRAAAPPTHETKPMGMRHAFNPIYPTPPPLLPQTFQKKRIRSKKPVSTSRNKGLRSRELRKTAGFRQVCPPRPRLRLPQQDRFHSAATFPASTVMEAFGSNTLCPFFHSTSLRFGGPSGSAWLVAPDECHTYSAAPNVTTFTCPVNCAAVSFALSSNAILTSCALLGSLLTTSSDQAPSG